MKYAVIRQLFPTGMVLLILCGWSSIVFAAEPVVLDQENLRGVYIGNRCEYLEDREGKLTIEDIQKKEQSSRFKHSQSDILNFSFTRSVYWVRFTVSNPMKRDFAWYLEFEYPLMDAMDLYVPRTGGGFTIVRASDYSPGVNQRAFFYHTTIYAMTAPPGLHTCYMRFASPGATIIPLKIWEFEALNRYMLLTNVIFGIIFGAALVMILYNVFLLVSVRDSTYLYFIINIMALFLMYFIIHGQAKLYLWPHSPIMNKSLPMVEALVGLSTVLFARSYLETAKKSRVINSILLIFGLLSILIGVSCIVLPFEITIIMTSLIIPIGAIFIIASGFVFMLRGDRPAVFYFIATVLFLAGGIIEAFRHLGTVPINFFTNLSGQGGYIAMLVLFSFGLADKINILKNELTDLNANLEEKVTERTGELSAAMTELEAMNQNLQDTLDELESTNEKLVSTRDALWGEMQLAKKIQTVLLPKEPEMSGYEIAAFMEPAAEVGGDYYDVIHAAGRDWVVIGDVSGHGVSAGLVMMMVQTSIQTLLEHNPALAPSALLSVINRTITRNILLLGENKYMTITVLACIENGRFHFAGLHHDLLVYRGKSRTVESIATNGMWIGIFDDIAEMLQDNPLMMEKGDTLLLFTDGVTEARDKGDKMYSEEKLGRLLGEQGDRSPVQVRDAILESLEGYDRRDDVTFLVVKRNR